MSPTAEYGTLCMGYLVCSLSIGLPCAAAWVRGPARRTRRAGGSPRGLARRSHTHTPESGLDCLSCAILGEGTLCGGLGAGAGEKDSEGGRLAARSRAQIAHQHSSDESCRLGRGRITFSPGYTFT